MDRRTVYIETTIPSALHSTREDPFSVVMRTHTRAWWDQRRRDFDLLTSIAMDDELRRGIFPHQQEMIAAMEAVPRLRLSAEVRALAAIYAEHRVVPRIETSLDGVHLAVACWHRCDYLLTWNIRHLANPNKEEHLRVLNDRLGHSTPRILTPEHFLEIWP